jgi:polyphosphate kinase
MVARLNSLSEPGVIQALYEASQAGVSIDLLVRGICCLRPGIPGVSENIRVRSIVGRFLEHSRVYYFFAGGAEELWCSSADWMERNFFRRFEVCFPILDDDLRSRALAEALELPLSDNQQSWELRSDGSYVRLQAGRKQPLRSQTALLEHHGERLRASPEKDGARRTGLKRRLQARTPFEDDEKRSRRA